MMATVANTLKLNDKMTPALKSIVTAINTTLRAMENMDVASNAAFRSAKRDAALATTAVSDFANSFDNVPPAAHRAEKSLAGIITKAISLTAIVFGMRKAFDTVGKVTGIADNMTQSASRLNLINDGLRTTLQYQDMIFASANRARSSYLDTVDAVTKLGTNAAAAFASTDEIIAFSELMNKSFKISGADAQAQAGAMRQLTQALASGVLRGDEFNSIAEQAPMVYEAIANYMGKSKGEIRKLAADGAITAAIVKNAMFTAAEDIEGRFADIPSTFSDQWSRLQNIALKAFRPVLAHISELAQTERFQRFTQDVGVFFYTAAGYAMDFVDTIAKIGIFVQDNGDIIVAVLLGISAALIILKAESIAAGVAMMIAGAKAGIAWLSAAWPILLIIGLIAALIIAYQRTEGPLQAIIGLIGIIVLAIGAWVAIQWVLNAALTANPIGAIIMAIVILIGIIIAIIAWVRNLWKTNMDFKYGVLAIWDSIIFFFKSIPNFFQWVGNGIADAFAWARVSVLTIMQDMANGVIGIINNLIAMLNMIPGVAIDPLNELAFAASIAAEEEAKKQARDQSLADNRASLEAEKQAQKAKRAADRAADQAALDAQAAADAKKRAKLEQGVGSTGAGGFDYSQFGGDGGVGGNMGDIGRVGSVGRIDDDVTISEEDIKLLKDLAVKDYQLSFTQLTPKAKFGDTYISKEADADAILEKIEGFVEESLQSSLHVGVPAR